MERVKKDMVVYKKAQLKHRSRLTTGVAEVIVKLLLRKGTWVNWLHEQKCRAEEAKVLGFQTLRGKALRLKKHDKVVSGWDSNFVYRKGAWVRPKGRKFYRQNVACAAGIHFYTSRSSAQRHTL